MSSSSDARDPAEETRSARGHEGTRAIEQATPIDDLASRVGHNAAHYLGVVLENLGAGALLIEGDGRRIILANQVLADLAGTSVADLLLIGRVELVHRIALRAEAPDEVHHLLGHIPDTGPYAADGRFTLLRPTRRVIQWTARPVRLPEGTGQLCIYRDVTGEADRAAELERVAVTDALTGLGNRRCALEALTRELAISSRRGSPPCIALYDLDHFKRVNDIHGHVEGDRVLREVGATLRECSRMSDIVTRWGGEEFLVLLPDCDLAGALSVADRCRDRLHAIAIGGVRGDVTLSGGIVRYRTGETADELVRRADDLLYSAKDRGRDRVEVDSSSTRADER